MSQTAYLDIDQGSDFTAIFELENDDSTPMNLFGFTVYSQFRKSYNSQIGYNFVATIVDINTGKISISLSGTASSAIKPGRYLYDIEIRGPGTTKTRVVEGIITINPEITKTPV
jgi:hypothetical protein